jgi:catechol 2,3-dioxygenase-like lactoylglutathione lyase family enzyme
LYFLYISYRQHFGLHIQQIRCNNSSTVIQPSSIDFVFALKSIMAPELSEEARKNRVQLTRIAYVTYGHPNLQEAEEFAKDFGLMEAARTPETIYFRGYGDLPLAYVVVRTDKPEFFGVTFEAQSVEDLEKAMALPGASKMENMAHQPGGGYRVTIHDLDDLPFHVIYGQQLVEREAPKLRIEPLNFPAESDENTDRKPRRGRWQRPEKGPAPVHKLGHCGYIVSDLPRSLDFYLTHFSFRESDSLEHPFEEGEAALTFMHVDKGKAFTDHHSFFVVAKMPNQSVGPHHAAFEVDNFDVQNLGHDHLKKKGYNLQWGIGRHGPGSQIFDYWFDVSGFVLEHYSDGDLVNDEVTFRRYPLDETDTWGPETPQAMIPASSS